MNYQNLELKNLNRISVGTGLPLLDKAVVTPSAPAYSAAARFTPLTISNSLQAYSRTFIHMFILREEGSQIIFTSTAQGCGVNFLPSRILNAESNQHVIETGHYSVSNRVQRRYIRARDHVLPLLLNSWHSIGIYIDYLNDADSWLYLNGSDVGLLQSSQYNGGGDAATNTVAFTLYSGAVRSAKIAHLFHMTGEKIAASGADFNNPATIMSNFIDTSTKKPKFGGVDGSTFLGVAPDLYVNASTDQVENAVDSELASFTGVNAATPPKTAIENIVYNEVAE